MAHCREEEALEKQLRESHFSHFSRPSAAVYWTAQNGWERKQKNGVGSFVEIEVARNDVHPLQFDVADGVQQEGVEYVRPYRFLNPRMLFFPS